MGEMNPHLPATTAPFLLRRGASSGTVTVVARISRIFILFYGTTIVNRNRLPVRDALLSFHDVPQDVVDSRQVAFAFSSTPFSPGLGRARYALKPRLWAGCLTEGFPYSKDDGITFRPTLKRSPRISPLRADAGLRTSLCGMS